MDNRIKVGAKCYLKAQGNEERYHRGKPMEEWIYEAEIIKVGRKYFTVKKDCSEIKYNIDDLTEVTDYCSDWEFHFDKQEILDEMEIKKLEWDIKIKFSGYGFNSSKLSLEQLRRIMDIINE